MSTYQTGLAAEENVIRHYAKAYNTSLLHHRYRTPFGEIDLILQAPDKIHFVEVKARKTLSVAAHSLRPAQLTRITHAILQFGADYPHLNDCVFQFDVALVIANTHIEVIENIMLDGAPK